MPLSLLLTNDWDITLDEKGYLSTTTGPYAIAQNVSNAVRLFNKDAYFDQEEGIPHFSLELGYLPQKSALSAYINDVSKTVGGVRDAVTEIKNFNENRVLDGVIHITTTDGEKVDATI